MRRRLTKEESDKLKAAEQRLKLANEKLAQSVANGTTSTEDRLRRTIKRAQKELNEVNESINARIAARKEDYSEELLASIKEEFPLVGTGSVTDWGKVLSGEPQVDVPEEAHSFNIEEITTELSKTSARLESLGSTPQFSAARKYLIDRVDTLRSMLRQLREEEAAAIEREKEAQSNRDFLAAESDIAPLRNKLEARLSAGPLSIEIREKTRQTFLELAAKNKLKAKEAGNVIQDGIHPRAIFEARAEWYQKSANQLKVFEYDLNQNQPIHALDGFDKEFWDSGRVISPSNINFRSKQEKALLIYCARKYYESTGNHTLLVQLPDFPNPMDYRVPNAQVPLEYLQRIETENALKALQPLHWESLETIFKVETAGIENPHSKPLLLWPTGREVVVDGPKAEVLFDRKSNGWRRMPEPMALEPDWNTNSQRYDYSQNEYGDWVKTPISNAPQTSWSQDTTGHFVPDSSLPNGQWKRMPLLKMIQGDHKPGPDDDRTEFRYGSWFTKEECERADKAQMNLRLLTMPEQQCTIADQIATERNSTVPLSQEEANSPWRRWESQQKLNEEKHV